MLRTLLLLGAAGAGAALETGVVSVGVSTFAASFANDYQQPVVIAGIPSSVACLPLVPTLGLHRG